MPLLPPLTIPLASEEDTCHLASTLAHNITLGNFSVLLLKGNLGAGKTTLVRHLVKALPNGEKAEVSSPSFTLMNVYETTPPIQHFDLYRLDPFIYDENLDEALDDVDNVVFIEWAERIPSHLLPQDYLECTLIIEDSVRKAIFKAEGSKSPRALEALFQEYSSQNV